MPFQYLDYRFFTFTLYSKLMLVIHLVLLTRWIVIAIVVWLFLKNECGSGICIYSIINLLPSQSPLTPLLYVLCGPYRSCLLFPTGGSHCRQALRRIMKELNGKGTIPFFERFPFFSTRNWTERGMRRNLGSAIPVPFFMLWKLHCNTFPMSK